MNGSPAGMNALPGRRTCGYAPFVLFSCVPLNFQHFESLIRALPLEGVAIKYNICNIEPYQNHNANSTAIRVVLNQEDKPVAFFSKNLNERR